jgi:hypothetical protein
MSAAIVAGGSALYLVAIIYLGRHLRQVRIEQTLDPLDAELDDR